MEFLRFENIDLAKVLPKLPEEVKDNLPFGLIRLDAVGKILEYNTAEGQMTGVDPKWAIGKKFFDEVAPCTKTDRFYGKFVEGVTTRFLNTVIDYVFDYRMAAVNVKVHMVSMPNHLGKIEIALMIARTRAPVSSEAFEQGVDPVLVAVPVQALKTPDASSTVNSTTPKKYNETPSVDDIVKAVMGAMNRPQAKTE